MEITNSKKEDIDEIFRMYGWATSVQRSMGVVAWPQFRRELIELEIKEGRQWKMVVEGKIACIWATAFRDPFIWGDRDEDPALYLHRIATRPSFKGNNLVSKVVEWATAFASSHGKDFVRLDTVGKNQKLITHYQNCGFTYLGLFKLEETSRLPSHYRDAEVSLFQIDIRGIGSKESSQHR